MKVKNIMLCATAVVPSLAWAKELPNIIYIVTDQQTASAMSCMGNDDLHTRIWINWHRRVFCSVMPIVLRPEWTCQGSYVLQAILRTK